MFLPLELTLRPSRIYMAALAMAHGFGLVGVWLAAVPVGIQSALTIALIVSVIWAWREISSVPRGLRVSQSGQLELLYDEWQSARIQDRPVVLPWFVSLSLAHEPAGRSRIMLWADSVEAEPFRRLRVWLKWGMPSSQS